MDFVLAAFAAPAQAQASGADGGRRAGRHRCVPALRHRRGGRSQRLRGHALGGHRARTRHRRRRRGGRPRHDARAGRGRHDGWLALLRNVFTDRGVSTALAIVFGLSCRIGGISYTLEHRSNEKIYSMPWSPMRRCSRSRSSAAPCKRCRCCRTSSPSRTTRCCCRVTARTRRPSIGHSSACAKAPNGARLVKHRAWNRRVNIAGGWHGRIGRH